MRGENALPTQIGIAIGIGIGIEIWVRAWMQWIEFDTDTDTDFDLGFYLVTGIGVRCCLSHGNNRVRRSAGE